MVAHLIVEFRENLTKALRYGIGLLQIEARPALLTSALFNRVMNRSLSLSKRSGDTKLSSLALKTSEGRLVRVEEGSAAGDADGGLGGVV